MGASWQKKAKPDLGCLDSMTLPIKPMRRVPITGEYRRCKKVRLYNRQWHVRNYTPHPRCEPECDPAEIEARTARIRREKDVLRAVGRLR